MLTAQEILKARGKTADPVGQRLGLGPHFGSRYYFAEIVKVTTDKKFVLKTFFTRPDKRPGRGNHSVVVRTGRMTINQDDNSVVFN
jgi:hypothetical protein